MIGSARPGSARAWPTNQRPGAPTGQNTRQRVSPPVFIWVQLRETAWICGVGFFDRVPAPAARCRRGRLERRPALACRVERVAAALRRPTAPTGCVLRNGFVMLTADDDRRAGLDRADRSLRHGVARD